MKKIDLGGLVAGPVPVSGSAILWFVGSWYCFSYNFQNNVGCWFLVAKTLTGYRFCGSWVNAIYVILRSFCCIISGHCTDYSGPFGVNNYHLLDS